MNNGTVALTIIFFTLLIVFAFIAFFVGLNSAYHNGVRDGYQNTWLPHVQIQIHQERLQQGEEVKLKGEQHDTRST